MTRIRNVLFDLDGTLTDPAEGIVRCIQHSLTTLNVSCPPAEELTRYIGPPLREVFVSICNSSDEVLVERAVGVFRERFSTIGLFENTPYPQVSQMLLALQSRYKLFVATSKPQVYAERILAHFSLADHFIEIHEILSMNHLESRHYLQAWNFLRTLGEQPPADEAKHLYGVVIEVALDEGVDVLAAYEDHTARYINYSSAGVVWEHPNDSLNESIDDLLNAGRRIVDKIGPWEGPRPSSPPVGQARICMLVPLGLHFGQASYDVLSRDQLAGPVLEAGVKLMQGLIEASSQTVE